jgi:uncharacterized protein (UPF0276 family)
VAEAAAVGEASALLPAGVGLGWRPALAGVAARRECAFLEVVAESLPGPAEPLPAPLADAREGGAPVVVHGVSLGLGSAEGLDRERLERLAQAAARLGSPVVSEHIAFVAAGGLAAGHLLPMPHTFEALAVLTESVRRAQDALAMPLALEHVAALFEWPDAEMDAPDFLCRLLDATGCRLVLDVANLHADAVNFGRDPLQMLDRLPLERVAYVHVAGGVERDGVWHDSHAAAVPDAVFALANEVAARRPGLPFLLERDDNWPPAREIEAELDRLAAAVREPVHA